ncbi:rRNA biogenesis protein rrp5, partial [Tulasnella sp. 403]
CYDTGVLVEYFGGVVAFVGREELSDEHVPSVTDAFPLGRVIKTRIIAINPVNRKLSASIRKAVSEPKAPVAGKQLTIGAIVDALVVAVHENRVQLEIEGKVPAVCFIRDLASHKNEDVAVIRSAIKAGDVIPGLEVRRKDRAGDAFICGPPRQFHKEPREKLAPTQQIGEVVEAAVVCRKGSHTELTVEGVKATLFPTDACDNYGESDPQPFPEIGSTVRAVVVAVKKTSLDLSTRRSRSQPNSDTKIVNPEITSTHDLHLEQSIGGFVYEAEEKYFRVSIGRRVSAILPKTALGPHNVEVGSIIKARIMELNDKKIVLSLRSRDRVQQAAAKRLALEDLVIGREINTRVERVKNNGLILRIDHTKISGLCRRVELTDNAHADVEEALQGFKPGDLLHAIILKVDIEKKEVEFSLRKSRLSAAEGSSKGAENLLPFDATEVEMQETFGIIGSYTTRRKTTQSKESEHLGEISDEDDDHVVIRMDGDGHIPETSKPDVVEAPSGPALSLFGFNWFGTHQNNSDAMSDEEDNEVGPPTPVDGLNDAGSNSGGMDVDDDDERMPGSSAEFERRLKETPDSSTLWIQFMASQLQLSEIDKAREVGRRAVE